MNSAPPMVPTATPRRLTLPIIGSSYPQVLRTPRLRWWRPLVSLLVVAVLALIVLLVPGLVLGVLAVVRDGDIDAAEFMDPTNLAVNITLNLSLAALILVTLIGVRVAYPVAAGFVHSVAGRVRWAWLARLALLLLPLWLVYVIGAWWLDGATVEARPDNWQWLLVLAFVLTPFQSAGEEYLFRGWVMLWIGSMVRNVAVALVLAVVVSAGLFAAAHGSADPWIVFDLVAMSIVCVYLTWRTGGLEAAVAIHVVNNVVVIVLGVLNGTIADSYIDETTAGEPLGSLIGVVVMALAAVLVLWQAKKAGVAREVPHAMGARR